MGLDMYLEGSKYHWTKWENPESAPTEDGFKLKEKILEVGYWRKHPNLHGYIVQNFAEGEDNCQPISLSADNIRAIIAAIKAEQLPHTRGFFFGESGNSPEEAARDVAIFEKALAWLEAEDKEYSHSLIYRASW